MGTVVNILQRAHGAAWTEMLARKAEWEATFERGASPAEIVQAWEAYRAARAREIDLAARIIRREIKSCAGA